MQDLKQAPMVRVNRQLGLDDEFEPSTAIQQVLDDAGLDDKVYVYLRNSETPEAKAILKLYRPLDEWKRKKVTIDHLIAAAGVDHIKVLGAISEEVFRARQEASTLIAAISSPDAMKSAAFYAGTPDGHADRKMILQTVKVAPVPTNQINRFNLIGNKIDKSQHIHMHVPSLEEVVRDVDAITASLPKTLDHVPSAENS